MSYPRYVQAGTVKWEKPDLDAVTDHVLAGESDTGFYAYPYSFIVRNIGGVYDAINSVGTRVYGGAADAGGVSGSDASAVMQAVNNNADTSYVFFDKGTFVCNTQVIWNKRLTLVSGSQTTILGATTGLGGIFKLQEQVRMKGLTFDTVAAVNSVDTDDIAIYVDGDNLGDFTLIEDITIYRYGCGIFYHGSWVNNLIRPNLYNNYVGIKMDKNLAGSYNQFLNVFGGKIELSRSYPLHVVYGKYCYFNGVYFGNQSASIYLEDFRGIFFKGGSIEPDHDINCIEVPANAGLHDELEFENIPFDLWGDAAGAQGIVADSINGLKLSHWTIANVAVGKVFLTLTGTNTNISVDAPIYATAVGGSLFGAGVPIPQDNAVAPILIPFTVDAGATDIRLFYITFQTTTQNLWIKRLTLNCQVAPGAGENVTVTVTDGTHTMSVTVADANTSATSNTDNFLFIPYTYNLLIKYSASAGATEYLASFVLETQPCWTLSSI